jgi:hypothetical protein
MQNYRASTTIASESTKSSRRAMPARRTLSRSTKNHVTRDIKVENIVEDLMVLFAHLGLDGGSIFNFANNVRRSNGAPKQTLARLAAISDLLTTWHQDPSFLDSCGDPAPLTLNGRRHSFRQIAKTVLPNVPATQLLRELVRLRAVRVDQDGKVHVKMRTLSIYEDKRLAALHTLSSLHGFINTLRHNLESAPANSAQLFHRVARNCDFDRQKIPQLKIWLRRHGQSLLESVDIWMVNQSKPRVGARPKKRAQVSVGVYLVVDP